MRRPAPTRGSARLAAAGALALALTGSALAAAGQTATAAPRHPGSDVASTGQPAQDRVVVRFAGDPLATSGKVDRRSNDKVDLNGSRTRSVSATLAAQRNRFRSWLRSNAPQARVTSEYDFMLNAVAVRLNGTSAEALRSAPGVVEVAYQGTYVPAAHEDPDLARIDAPQGWAAARATSLESDPRTWAGSGVQVGVIDSGIDVHHPCFDDAGFPRTRQRGDLRFTNDKVVVARVFNNQANRSGYTPEAVDDHGTHVAGTVACALHAPALVEDAGIPYDPSGVAPGAQLGNYNVFPGDAASARTEDILNALQAAARDGMDVINMSLGGSASGVQDLGTLAVDNLDRAGIVVAVSAGNSGPGQRTISSPGSAERALTAGASTVGHYVGVPISADRGRVTVAATGDFPVPDRDLTTPLEVVRDGAGALSTACAPLGGSNAVAGAVALVSRGGCSFGTKIINAERAGAVAVIVVSNLPGDPTAMGGDGVNEPTIPAVMAPLGARAVLVALDGALVTIGDDAAYERSAFDDVLASFSSRGPVDVSYRVKPDVVGPGVNVLSAVTLADCAGEPWVAAVGCWAFFSGTSMASPHLAGMSAVVIDAHPAWTSAEVRSAIVNTAEQDAVKRSEDPSEVEIKVQYVGAGLADLDAAVRARVALSSPSVSFGAVPRGSGRSATVRVAVTNLTDTRLALPLRVQDSTGDGSFSVTPTEVTLAPGGNQTVTVAFSAPRRATEGSTQAMLHLGSEAHAALYAFLK